MKQNTSAMNFKPSLLPHFKLGKLQTPPLLPVRPQFSYCGKKKHKGILPKKKQYLGLNNSVSQYKPLYQGRA